MTTAPFAAQISMPARASHLRLAARSLLAGFALSAAVIAGATHLAAAPAGHNSNAPVDFAATHMELQDKQKRVVLSGSVVITQEELRLTADRTLMAYSDGGRLQLNRIDATGGVVVTQRDQRAAGDVAVYDLNRKVITMVGHVALKRGNGDTLNGGRLVINLESGISSIDGHGGAPAPVGAADMQAGNGGGRVSGTFNVPQKGEQP